MYDTFIRKGERESVKSEFDNSGDFIIVLLLIKPVSNKKWAILSTRINLQIMTLTLIIWIKIIVFEFTFFQNHNNFNY